MNQFSSRTPKKLPKYITKTKVDVILEKARSDNTRNYLILVTLWRTGMRVSELVNITKRDVGSDQITIRQGKGHKDRIVPADSGIIDLLTLHSASMNLDDLLFPLSEVTVRNICHKYQDDEYLHPHTLRHSFAVHCLKSGMNIRVLQKILGHTNLSTTAIYLDLIGEDIKTFLNDYFIEIESAEGGQILNEIIHKRKIMRLTQDISQHYRPLLLGGRLKIGRAQKLVNLYLKYIWRLRWIEAIPPHCPFDRIVLEKGLNIKDNWTEVDNITIYNYWVRTAKRNIKNNENLAEWEYRNYPIWSGEGHY